MAEYIYLTGSEDVKNAGHRIAQAAEAMQGAADSMHHAVDRMERLWREEILPALEVSRG